MPKSQTHCRSRPLVPPSASRRALLLGLPAWGVAMQNLLHWPPRVKAGERASLGPGFARAKSVIMVYASGGQSQLEMWDPKPSAPAVVRGEFSAIPTAVPGTFLGEHLPRMARAANLYTILRGMSHTDLDHGSAGYLTLTGRYHAQQSSNPPPKPTDDPTLGAVLTRARLTHRFPCEAVHVNGPALVPEEVGPGQDGGYLGRGFEPLVISDVHAGAEALPGLELNVGVDAQRLHERLKLKGLLDEPGRDLDGRLSDMSVFYRRAAELMVRPEVRRAFDLSDEPDMLHDAYGRHQQGQSCLLARRLVQAGVSLVTVIWNRSNRGQDKYPRDTDAYGWDTHNDIFFALREHLLPRFDQAMSALLHDLSQQGLLDDTLVICQGEFGRAPVVALEKNFKGSTPGRKHWARAYSILAAGAGVHPGGVLGSTDRHGGEVTDGLFAPWDVAATIFWALGLDPREHFQDAQGRPIAISTGTPITGLFR